MGIPKELPKIKTEDVMQRAEASFDMSKTIEEIESPQLQTDVNIDAQYMRDLAFMEQKVTFVIGESLNDSEPNPILLGNNGEQALVWRGVEYTLPRKILDSAINHKTDYKTAEVTTSDGSRQTQVRLVNTPAYQISIIQDPAGRDGANWFANRYSVRYA